MSVDPRPTASGSRRWARTPAGAPSGAPRSRKSSGAMTKAAPVTAHRAIRQTVGSSRAGCTSSRDPHPAVNHCRSATRTSSTNAASSDGAIPLSVHCWKSLDGGETWSFVPGPNNPPSDCTGKFGGRPKAVGSDGTMYMGMECHPDSWEVSRWWPWAVYLASSQ